MWLASLLLLAFSLISPSQPFTFLPCHFRRSSATPITIKRHVRSPLLLLPLQSTPSSIALSQIGLDETTLPQSVRSKLRSSNVEGIVDLLARQYGVEEAREIVVNNPKVLLSKGFDDPLLLPLTPYLLSLGLTPTSIKSLHARNPNVLHLKVPPSATIAWLSGIVGDKKVKKIITRHPWLLGLSLDKNVEPTVAYLTGDIGVTDSGMKGMVERHTGVFSLGLSNVQESVSLLQTLLDLTPSTIGAVISRHPGILALKVSNLESKVVWHIREFGEKGGKR